MLDGNNADDVGDWRPGQQAARELGVRSPLMEIGMSKAEVRELSHALGLRTWDKPAFACLASRIPYGTAITREKLGAVEEAENFLRDLGFAQVRVRITARWRALKCPRRSSSGARAEPARAHRLPPARIDFPLCHPGPARLPHGEHERGAVSVSIIYLI